MAKVAVARRYAEALVEAASGANLLDEIETQLRMVVETVESDPQLALVLRDPKVLVDQKKAILDKLFGDKVHSYLLNALKVLVDKKRTDHLKDMYDLYVQLANDVRGVVEAVVTTAKDLGCVECDRLIEELSRMTGKKVKLKINIDPTIIGGAKVRIGDMIIDASLDSRLAGLERSLSNLRFNVEDNGDTD